MHLQSGLCLVINLSLNQAQQYFSVEWSGSIASVGANLANFDLMYSIGEESPWDSNSKPVSKCYSKSELD